MKSLSFRKDLIGVQICGAVKNIFAIASGILGGLGYSESKRFNWSSGGIASFCV